MDFLERIFSLSPDGGSGATEVLLLCAALCGVLAVLVRASGLRSMSLITSGSEATSQRQSSGAPSPTKHGFDVG